MEHPTVKAAFEAAWADSFAEDEVLRHEEGGWIILENASGMLTIRRELPGTRNSITFHYPDLDSSLSALAIYHTHPTPPELGEIPDPSPADRSISREWKLTSFVIAESAIFIINPLGTVSSGEVR